MSGDKVHNGQPHMGQTKMGGQKGSAVIRAAAPDPVIHGIQDLLIFGALFGKIAFGVEKARNSAHRETPFKGMG